MARRLPNHTLTKGKRLPPPVFPPINEIAAAPFATAGARPLGGSLLFYTRYTRPSSPQRSVRFPIAGAAAALSPVPPRLRKRFIRSPPAVQPSTARLAAACGGAHNNRWRSSFCGRSSPVDPLAMRHRRTAARGQWIACPLIPDRSRADLPPWCRGFPNRQDFWHTSC